MSWRTIVISERSKLDFKMNYMVVRDTETTRFFIDEIAVLVIESQSVSMTAYLREIDGAEREDHLLRGRPYRADGSRSLPWELQRVAEVAGANLMAS